MKLGEESVGVFELARSLSILAAFSCIAACAGPNNAGEHDFPLPGNKNFVFLTPMAAAPSSMNDTQSLYCPGAVYTVGNYEPESNFVSINKIAAVSSIAPPNTVLNRTDSADVLAETVQGFSGSVEANIARLLRTVIGLDSVSVQYVRISNAAIWSVTDEIVDADNSVIASSAVKAIVAAVRRNEEPVVITKFVAGDIEIGLFSSNRITNDTRIQLESVLGSSGSAGIGFDLDGHQATITYGNAMVFAFLRGSCNRARGFEAIQAKLPKPSKAGGAYTNGAETVPIPEGGPP